ncbi:MAG TPA: alpha/beta hydrolase-fold protein [Prolixibacteraceae bacterium]|nr:alpha/beta hydrolase-fold protein [Prolixibacteraceae bacterium]
MMTRKILTAVVLTLFLLPLSGAAQEEYVFSQGLAVGNCHQYGRQGFYSDQFAWRYFEPGFKAPKAGEVLYTDSTGRKAVWREIVADSSGLFRGRQAFNGYLYLSYHSQREQNALLHISGNVMFYLNGEPHAGDVYGDKWLYTPVRLRKGVNALYIRTGYMSAGVSARLLFPETPVLIRTEDATLPDMVEGRDASRLMGAVVVVNATSRPLKNLRMRAMLAGRESVTDLPDILPLSTRKVMFRVDGSEVKETGPVVCQLAVMEAGKEKAGGEVILERVAADKPYKCTFISEIDGSLQYYAVQPRKGGSAPGHALFLSVHGAGVEAIGQARAYGAKEEGDLAAPTNRRPRGFNWEDWGRIDAMEVLNLAEEQFRPSPDRIYLTGHSMGGHGTWILGATYPGKWAAIAPCAGYPSLLGYASADGKIPQPGNTIQEQNLYRASNGSNVFELARNYAASGVYIHHGDDDQTVSVEYARQMREVLGKFHTDFCYYEYPGGSHWWSNESVDWPPLFSFFRHHRLIPADQRNHIDFTTANPAVSATFAWVTILQQEEPLNYSRVRLTRDPGKGTITGETENTTALTLDLSQMKGQMVTLEIDGSRLEIPLPGNGGTLTLLRKGTTQQGIPTPPGRDAGWEQGTPPGAEQKGLHRNGTFKEPFNHRMVFVYGTSGTREENAWAEAKARFDAETWYYRGNGSVDIVADRDFKPADYSDRGIILFGNAVTNSAWAPLLGSCPIQVTRGSLTMGGKTYSGDHLGAYLMYPRPGSDTLTVGAITGTGLPGMRAAYANQYFTGGSGFPDFMIFTTGMVRDGVSGILEAGFFDNHWKL